MFPDSAFATHNIQFFCLCTAEYVIKYSAGIVNTVVEFCNIHINHFKRIMR